MIKIQKRKRNTQETINFSLILQIRETVTVTTFSSFFFLFILFDLKKINDSGAKENAVEFTSECISTNHQFY